MPYKSKRRPSVSRKLKIVMIVCFSLVAALVLTGLYLDRQETLAANATAAEQYVAPPPAATGDQIVEGPVVAFLGDSYTVGARASSENTRWSSLVSKELGWSERNFGIADTGYLVEGSMANGAPYADRIPAVAEAKPEIVVVSGGLNDMFSSTADIVASINATYAELRAALPDARIIAVSPLWTAVEPVPEQMSALNDAVREAAASVNAEYVDLGQPLVGKPEWMHTDKVHPLDEGYAAIAEAFLSTG